MIRLVTLIIPIYFVTVNCISNTICRAKCEKMPFRIPSDHFKVKDNTCVCSYRLGSHNTDYSIDFDKFCIDYYNVNSTYTIISTHMGAYMFDCIKELKCDDFICDKYCKNEQIDEEYTSYCHNNHECRCDIKDPNKDCIVSTNKEHSVINYHPQNNFTINDILFNLQKLLNLHLCPLLSKNKNNSVSVVNGTITNADVNNFTYNECEISCEHTGECERCFKCRAASSKK